MTPKQIPNCILCSVGVSLLGVVRVFYGDANEGFTAAQSIVGFGYFEGAFNDVDGDGNLDIVFREIDPGMNGKNTPTGEYSLIELEAHFGRAVDRRVRHTP